MSHVRQQIREALVIALTGLPTTASRVFVNRAKALATSDLPGLVVRVMDEDLSDLTLDWPPIVERRVRVELEVLAGGPAAADTLDTALEEIESALASSIVASDLGGLLKSPIALSGVAVQFDDDTNPIIGSLIANYIATYHAAADAPGTHL